MPYEWIILGLLAIVLVLSLLKRLIWVAIVVLVVALLMHLGVIELAYEFVKNTLLQAPPISIKIG